VPKAPRSRKSVQPSDDTFDPLEGISELFADMSDQQKALHVRSMAWTRHPLGESLDAAETLEEGGKGPAGPVDRALMERNLREVLSHHPTSVYLVHSSQSLPGAEKGKEKPSWLLMVGDGDDPGKALAELASRSQGLSSSDLPFRDVVVWARRWDAATWERMTDQGLGVLEERPIWLKIWESSGSLLGPFRFLQ
jgi:hypothetical protein